MLFSEVNYGTWIRLSFELGLHQHGGSGLTWSYQDLLMMSFDQLHDYADCLLRRRRAEAKAHRDAAAPKKARESF